MGKSAKLLPDYVNFVKGMVASKELSLNILQKMLQHNR
nr:hypothetical protein [Bacillus wiedmannii]